MKHDSHYFVYDLETGGFYCHLHPITQVAIIVLDPELKEVERYETYIKPYDNLQITADALKVTGLKMEDINNGIEVEQFYKDFVGLCKKYKRGRAKPVMVGANNAAFDKNFMSYVVDKCFKEAKFKNGELSLHKFVDPFHADIMWMSRMKWGHVDVDNHQLGSICKRLGVELTDAHEAMNDTVATKECFVKLVEEMRGEGSAAVAIEKGPRAEGFQF